MASRTLAALRELRLHFCQTSPASQGAREFVEKHYLSLKEKNPNLPILVRECSGVQPKIWARYAFGKETSVAAASTAEEILQQVHALNDAK